MPLKNNPHWVNVQNKVHALSVRERAILLGLVVTLLVGVVDRLWLTPLMMQKKALQTSMSSAQASLQQLAEKIADLGARSERDPNEDARKQIQSLTKTRAALEKELETASRQFVPPSKMPELLGNLMFEKFDLSVISVKSLPVQEIRSGDASNQVKLYEHAVEIKLRGGFAGLKRYLEEVEKTERRLIWDRLDFKVDEYPAGDIRLVVKTMGTGKEFIGVYR